MTDDHDADRVWNFIEKIGFCMLCTHDGEDIRARPMAFGRIGLARAGRADNGDAVIERCCRQDGRCRIHWL